MGKAALAEQAMSGLEDGASRYLHEIGTVDLLSVDEEIALANRIRQGDQQARQQFIEANLRLTVYVAKRFLSRGVDFEDLVQEGNVGLIEAVDRFDPTRGTRFANYAVHWIAKSIRDYLTTKAPAVPLPKDARRDRAALRAAEDTFVAEHGRPPSITELSELTGISAERATYLLRPTTETPMSLETPIDDDGTPLGAALSDTNTIDPSEEAEKANLKQFVLKLTDNLSPRERFVVVSRYLNEMTRDDLGRVLGVTAQRVAQIEQRALLRLQLAAA